MNILFLLSQQPNPRFVKQINYLSKNHFIQVIYFSRIQSQLDFKSNINSKVIQDELGFISNRKYFSRVFQLFKFIKRIKLLSKNRKFDVVIYNNTDVLLLSAFYNIIYSNIKKSKTVLEIADLREISFSKSLYGQFYRILERITIKSMVSHLIVTSKKFYSEYYSKFYSNEVFVLENKPLAELLPLVLPKKKSEKIRIGAVGGFRGRATKLVLDTVKDIDWAELRIHGFGNEIDLIESYNYKYENIKYFGPFNFFNEIAEIYAEIDILYVVYDIESSKNIKLALPNKLYEAMYFNIPLIVSEGTYLEEIVKEKNIGYAINKLSKKGLIEVLNNFKINRKKFNFSFENVSSNFFIGDDDYLKLEEFLTN